MPLPLPQPMVVRMMIMLGFSVCDLAYGTLRDTQKKSARGMKLHAEHLVCCRFFAKPRRMIYQKPRYVDFQCLFFMLVWALRNTSTSNHDIMTIEIVGEVGWLICKKNKSALKFVNVPLARPFHRLLCRVHLRWKCESRSSPGSSSNLIKVMCWKLMQQAEVASEPTVAFGSFDAANPCQWPRIYSFN